MTVTPHPAITETMSVPTETLLAIHASMHRIRAFEERMREMFLAGRLPGFVHLYVGQEAVASSVCAALRTDDYIASTHRGHGHALAKGARMDRMAAEIMGKATGMCGGKGGSMHVADFSVGMLGCNGIVGGGVGIVAGAAFSAQHRKTDQVAVAFFGDGASSKGTFHEALNFAAARKLPAIFVCENNGYAQFTAPEHTISVQNIADRALGYGIPGVVVDGQDASAMYRAASEAVARARRGDGPTLIEAKTFRYYGHYVGDPENYRTKEEVAAWRARDPIALLERELLDRHGVDAATLDRNARAAADEMDAAEKFAVESPLPEAHLALEGIFAPSEATEPRAGGEPRDLTFGEATREAMREAMAADPNVVVMGEDIHWGGNFGQFTGLYDEFGPDRVIDMPISESVIVSAALGAAITGLRPIISMSFVDFTLGAMDELINQVAKIRYMFGGQTRVPLVFRASDGAVRQAAAQHSQCLEVIFAHLPGLKVAAPSNVADAKGLLAASIADGNPVMYLEHKVLGKSKGPVPSGNYVVPLGKATVARAGADVTVITYSLMTRLALEVAEELAAGSVGPVKVGPVTADPNGSDSNSAGPNSSDPGTGGQASGGPGGDGRAIDVEVIDLRTLAPLDWDIIAASVRKTHRAVIVHEAYTHAGLGAEIAARIGHDLFDDLDAPVGRVGAKHAPMPFSPPLENEVLPSKDDVRRAILAAVGR